MVELPKIKATVLGNCGHEHASFEEWQACHVCEAIAKQHNKTGAFAGDVLKVVADANWNTAIDKCIEVANKYDSYGPAYEMRMLKK